MAKQNRLLGAILLIALFASLWSSQAQQPSTSPNTLRFQANHLTIQLHDPRDQIHLNTVFVAWAAARSKLLAIGLQPGEVRLEAFSDARSFAQATTEPWFVAASTKGQLIRTQRLGALKAKGLLELTIKHEAFHAAQPRHLSRWLAEGLARIFSGESDRDAKGPTGLERLSNFELDSALLGRNTPNNLPLAYLEATKRAGDFLRLRGWIKALKP